MTRYLLVGTLLLSPVAASAQNLMAPQPPRSVVVPNDAALSTTIAEWNALRQTDALPFSSYARFLVGHPGWPGEAALRRAAERALRADSEDANLVVAYFNRYPPTTATNALRHAEALDATGRRDLARSTARQAWTLGVLSTDDEVRLMTRFPGVLTSADHDARMDRLLWSRVTPAAVRQLSLTSPARQPLYGTRVSLQTKAPDAASRIALVADAARGDAGLLHDRVTWLRTTGQEMAARALLAQPTQFTAPPLDPERWMELRYGVAKNAAAQGQASIAFDIARQLDAIYPAGTVVRERSFGERDEYTNLAWLAGTLAMDRLGRPIDAIGMFDLYAQAARSPQTQSKGLYWAGRAAEAAGRRDDANRYYEACAVFFDQFYGQLATERLGRTLAIPAVSTEVEVSQNQRQAFFDSEVVRAARLVGQRGDHVTQTLFVRQIAQMADSDVDHALAIELSRQIARPDLGVMIGRSAGLNGLRDYVRAGFPVVPVPAEALPSWIMVHAITRQESQFDREAISRAGARGLMQLMPGTARETAGKIGLDYSAGALTQDPQYNIRLGSWYFGRMMDYFGGNYVLAVAAYNAGPGNVNRWLRSNGDPRAGADVLRWIEDIPLTETRGYVQRVLENAVVYELIDPSKVRVRSATPLSTYLGKSSRG